jgi:translation elongation factor EF-1alpha
MPSGDVGTVRSLERDSKACDVARAGDNVTVSLQGIDGSNVMTGGVLCHPDFPVAVARHFELKVLLLDLEIPLVIGSQVSSPLQFSFCSIACSISLQLESDRFAVGIPRTPRKGGCKSC